MVGAWFKVTKSRKECGVVTLFQISVSLNDDRTPGNGASAGTTATSVMTRVCCQISDTTNSSDCTKLRVTRRTSVPHLRTFHVGFVISKTTNLERRDRGSGAQGLA